MLDIKWIRENPEEAKKRIARRNPAYVADIDAMLQLDRTRRELVYQSDSIKARQNEASKKIPAMKKAGEEPSPLFAEMKQLAAQGKEIDGKLKETEELCDLYYSQKSVSTLQLDIINFVSRIYSKETLSFLYGAAKTAYEYELKQEDEN